MDLLAAVVHLFISSIFGAYAVSITQINCTYWPIMINKDGIQHVVASLQLFYSVSLTLLHQLYL